MKIDHLETREIPQISQCKWAGPSAEEHRPRGERDERGALPLVPFSARPTLSRSVHDHRRGKGGTAHSLVPRAVGKSGKTVFGNDLISKCSRLCFEIVLNALCQ